MLKDKLRLFEVQINLSTPQMMCVQISLYAFFRFCEINVLEMVLNHLFYPNLTIRCQKIEKGLLHTNSKLYTVGPRDTRPQAARTSTMHVFE